MINKEKEEILKAMFAEIEFWKFRITSPFRANTNTRTKGCYVPDFMLLLESKRILGRPAQNNEQEDLLRNVNEYRSKRRCTFEDFFKQT